MTVKYLGGALAAAAGLLAVPAVAQNNDAPVDVTAAPPPSAETVGPSQLRNFSLDGTVTRPADRPATTAPATTNQPRTVAPSLTEAPVGAPAVSNARPAPGTTAPLGSRPSAGASGSPANPVGITPTLPTGGTDTVPASAFDPSSTAQPAPVADAGGLSWPWVAALLALLAGGGFIAWSRRNRRDRYGDPGRMAFAGLGAGEAPEAKPFPPVRPRADPVPPRASPTPPRNHPIPPPVAKPTTPAPKPADDGLIVSTRLKPQLAIHFQPDRAVITEKDVTLQFDVVVVNDGSAPARDVLVEAQMICAHAGQDAEIAAFFAEPVGKGDRIPAIQPLGRLSLKSVVRLPLDQLRHFEAGGRTLFVPLVAFNVLHNGNAQTSASFLVGRGNEQDEKLAPFRLDLGPRIFRGLSSRPHSMGLTPQNAAA